MEYLLQFALLAAGFALLAKGADAFVDGAAALASRFGVSKLVIGLTIVAMGTSLPEAAVSISGALNDSAGIAIGNVIGSNICNILLILGVSSLLARLPVQRSTLVYEIPFMIFISAAFLFLGAGDSQLSRFDGAVLLALFALFLVYTMKSPSAGEDEDSGENLSVAKCCLYLVLGAGMIFGGSELAVGSATNLAKLFGISDRVIGLTVVALGTSLPELFTSAGAALKNEADLAIGNVVGSCIFNVLFVAGTSSAISAIPFEPQFYFDTVISIVCGVALLAAAFTHRSIGRLEGSLLLIGYAVYNFHLFYR